MHPADTATNTARPHPAAALLRTVTTRTTTGLTTLIQHWAADTRLTDGYARTEWITRTDISRDVVFTPQTARYTPGQLDTCRADWQELMTALADLAARSWGWTDGDTTPLPPPPYTLAYDRPAPHTHPWTTNRRPAPAPPGPLTIDMITAPTFRL